MSSRARSNSVCRAHIAREFGLSRANFASRAPEIIHSRPNAFQNAPKRHQNVPERPQNAPERPPEHPRTTPERPRTLENDHRMLHNDARMTASGNIWECLRSSGASRRYVPACDLPSLRPGKSLRARVRHLFEPKYIQNAPLDAPERSQNAPERPSRLLLCLFLGLLFWLV